MRVRSGRAAVIGYTQSLLKNMSREDASKRSKPIRRRCSSRLSANSNSSDQNTHMQEFRLPMILHIKAFDISGSKVKQSHVVYNPLILNDKK